MNSRNIKFKILKVLRFTSIIKSNQLFFSITCKDNFWGSHVGIVQLSTCYNNIGHHENIFNLNNISTIFRHLTPKKPWFSNIGVLLYPLYYACTQFLCTYFYSSLITCKNKACFIVNNFDCKVILRVVARKFVLLVTTWIPTK